MEKDISQLDMEININLYVLMGHINAKVKYNNLDDEWIMLGCGSEI